MGPLKQSKSFTGNFPKIQSIVHHPETFFSLCAVIWTKPGIIDFHGCLSVTLLQISFVFIFALFQIWRRSRTNWQSHILTASFHNSTLKKNRSFTVCDLYVTTMESPKLSSISTHVAVKCEHESPFGTVIISIRIYCLMFTFLSCYAPRPRPFYSRIFLQKPNEGQLNLVSPATHPTSSIFQPP